MSRYAEVFSPRRAFGHGNLRTLYTTRGLDPSDSFRLWRETVFERIVPLELTKLGAADFAGSIEAVEIGGLSVTLVSNSAVRSETTSATIRRQRRDDTVAVGITLSGEIGASQDGREAVFRPGDISVLDRRPTVVVSGPDSRRLVIEVPRECLERMLGSTRLYSAMTMSGVQASTSIATSFFFQLINVNTRLEPKAAARMASIGIDLVIATIAERLARDVPKPIQGTLVVQRAKAYVEANLGDHTLDPPHLAAAVGVSLRRLQQLFEEHGRHISDWIWQRRLEVAAQRLSDRGLAHLSIGVVAHGCGFVSQAHFARRFRDRYGLTPTEFRRSRLVEAIADAAEARSPSLGRTDQCT